MIVNPRLSRARFTRDIRPLLDESSKLEAGGIKLLTYDFPYLEVELSWDVHGRKLTLRVDATDYDYLPMSGWWVKSDGSPLLVGSGHVPIYTGINGSPNPFGKQQCWFCFRGWREFHDHESHQNVPWISVRGLDQYRALAVISQLHSDLNKAVQAQ